MFLSTLSCRNMSGKSPKVMVTTRINILAHTDSDDADLLVCFLPPRSFHACILSKPWLGLENNIRQIRQEFKSWKLQNSRGSESREMSRKSSRAHSRRGSMDILEEEMMQINKDTMFPEEEEEEFVTRSQSGSLFGSTNELHSPISLTRSRDDLLSDDDDMSPPISLSRRPLSRRPSIVALPTGSW